MPKRKLVQYEDSDLQSPRRQSNGYPNKSSRIESPKTNGQYSSSRKASASYNESNDAARVDPSGSSDDLRRLLGALGNILENNPKTHLLEQLGEEGYGQCERLQSILVQRSHGRLLNGTSLSPVNAHTQKQVEIPPPTSLTPWTSSSIPITTPPLPQILDPIREKEAFTHSAVDPKSCYERLEWTGDAYLELIATLLISSTFTNLTPGRCSQMRERLVKNETLAQFSREYGFERRAFLPAEFEKGVIRGGSKVTRKEEEKVMADIFEAYCAAIVITDLENGVNRLTNWLKALWARTLSSEILALEKLSSTKTRDQSYNPKNVSPKELLANKIVSPGIKVSYRDAAPEQKSSFLTGHPVFTVGVYLHGWGEEGKLLGIGTGLSKKEAGSEAAEAALSNKEVLKVYEEMKKEDYAKKRAELANAATPTAPGTSPK